MSSSGSGYDTSCSTYGPDGKIFQVEYALKAVERFGLALGVRGRDSVVMAVQKPVAGELEIDSNPRVFRVDDHALVLVAGMLPDGRALVSKCAEVASSYRDNYGVPVPTHVLADKISGYMQLYTHYSDVRPFGCVLMVAGVDLAPEPRLSLYQLDPSGDYAACFATTAGKRSAAARVELEKRMGEPETDAEDRFNHLRRAHNTGGRLTQMGEDQAASACCDTFWACFEELQDREFDLEIASIGIPAPGEPQAPAVRFYSPARCRELRDRCAPPRRVRAAAAAQA